MTHPVLDLPMQENDAEASTVRDYMKALLSRLMIEGGGFNGKRPFGNSSWFIDLEIPLVRAGLIAGEIDEDGFLETSDSMASEKLLLDAVKDL